MKLTRYSRLKTATNGNSKDADSVCVFRRYSDFETLRNYLVAKYSWVIVPVLPEKTVEIPGEKMSNDFHWFDYRRRFLIHGPNPIRIEQVSKSSNEDVFYSK